MALANQIITSRGALPLNIVVPNGELYSLTPGTEEYQLVPNIPKLVYTDINSNRFAPTDDGKLFDIVQRQRQPVASLLVTNEDDFVITQVIDHSSTHKKLLVQDGSVIVIRGEINENNWNTRSCHSIMTPTTLALIPTQHEQHIRSITAEDLENKLKTSLIVTRDGIYRLYGTSLDDRALVHNGNGVINCTSMLLWIENRSAIVIMLLMNTGEIMYILSDRGAWDESPSFGNWINIPVIINQPEKHRFVEIGDYRALVNEGGEVSIIDGVNGLTPIDLPLSCFNINRYKNTKSARAVVDSVE